MIIGNYVPIPIYDDSGANPFLSWNDLSHKEVVDNSFLRFYPTTAGQPDQLISQHFQAADDISPVGPARSPPNSLSRV